MTMSDLQRYLKSFVLINYELDINVFVSLNSSFSFAISLREWLAHFLLKRSNVETHRNKHFSCQKNDCIFHIFIRVRFKGYGCKSGIALYFTRRVTVPLYKTLFKKYKLKGLVLPEEKKIEMKKNWKKFVCLQISSAHSVQPFGRL